MTLRPPSASAGMSSTSAVSSTSAPLTAQRERERHLLERCRNGDLDAFDELVLQHQDRIHNLCYWMLNDRDEAADAAQEAFLRAFRGLPKFQGQCAFGTWLHRIAANVCLDALHKRKRTPIPQSSLSRDDDDVASPELADTRESPHEAAARHERTRIIRRALATLPEHYRVVLVLFDIQGHAYEEIAELLELPIGTVKSRLNRARGALREGLQAHRELFEA